MKSLPTLALFLVTTLAAIAQFTPLTRAIRTETFRDVTKNLTPELVNKPDQAGYHPLSYAIYTGNPKLVDAVLKAGANPNQMEFNGKTPLSVAANLGSPEILTLLHRSGATLPQGENARSVGKAAVLSGSSTTLDALFQLYPKVSVDRGWPQIQPTIIGERVTPGKTEGAFSHTINHGLFETAFALATKAPDLSHTDSSGRNALQMAASHAECPVEVVEALLKRGMKPTASFHSNIHIEPGTALDLAAARGSNNLIKAMLKFCDPRADLKSIAKSAYVASAHNHPETVRLLLGFIKGSIRGTEKWLADFEKKIGRSAVASPGQHNPIHDPEFELIPPNPRPQNLADNLAGTLAIISSDQLKNIAGLLTETFSNSEGLTVVEREQIKEIIREQNLARFKAKEATLLHRSLNLIPAEYVLLITPENLGRKKILQFSLLQTRTGLVLNRRVTPSDLEPSELQDVARSLLPHVQKSLTPAAGGITVSITPLKPEDPSASQQAICQQVNLALPVYASNTPGCALLERGQMSYLENEKALGVSGNYWSGSWVIDGGLRSPDPGKSVLTLRATRPGDGKSHQIKFPTSPGNLQTNLARAWQSLIEKLDTGSTTKVTPLPVKEVTILAKHAHWLFSAGYYDEAIALIDSCIVLDGKTKALQFLSLKARLAALPLSTKEACRHILANPRYLEPDKKFPLVRHFPRYLALSDNALHYLALTESGTTGSPNRVFNEWVSSSLKELMFFRVMMDDSEIVKTHQSEIRSLDLQIKHLAELYLKRIKGHQTEYHTLESLLKTDSGYCSLCSPDLFQDMSKRFAALDQTSAIPANRGLKGFVLENLGLAHRDGLPTDPWSKLLEKLDPGASTAFLPTSNRAQRLKLIGNLMRNWQPLTLNQLNLIGSEFPNRSLWGNRTPAPQGGLESYFLQDTERITETAEFRRMYGLYRSAYQITKDGVHDASLSRFLKPSAARDLIPITREGWKAIAPLLIKNPKATEKTRGILEKIVATTGETHSSPTRIPTPSVQPSPSGRSSLRLGQPAILLPAPTSSKYPVQFSHPGEITLKDHQLWIPVSLTAKEANQSSSQNLFPAIHVIDLQSEKIRTIQLPRDAPRARPRRVTDRLQSAQSDRRILIGKTKAYYLANSFNSPSKIYCIDRTSLKVQEVKLPQPYILAVTIEVVNDSLFLSLLSENKSNIVVQVEGTEVGPPLISTLRKPARSPLDHPGVSINHLLMDSGNLVALSIPGFVIRLPETAKAATLDAKTQEWQLATLKETEGLMRKYQASLDHYYFARHTLTIQGESFFPYEQMEVATLTFNPIENRLPPLISPRFSRFKSKLITLPVQVEKVASNAFHLPIKSEYQAEGQPPAWQSANEILTAQQFQVRVVGRYDSNVYLTLHRREIGFPAIWKVPFSTLEKRLAAKRK